VTIEPATVNDAEAISSVFAAHRDDPGLFQESVAQVKRNSRDFLVARDTEGKVVACAGLHHDSAELAEIYGVAVLPEFQGQGIGTQLIRKCEEKAVADHVTHLWLATIKAEYFGRHSFHPMSRWDLPASVLLRKLRQVFQQPVQRWIPALVGRHTFMQRSLVDGRPS
jgi:N-acetylglutamate synthase-like GNAT family acetyltransferase